MIIIDVISKWILGKLINPVLEKLFTISLVDGFFIFLDRNIGKLRFITFLIFLSLIYISYKLFMFGKNDISNIKNIMTYQRDPTAQEFKGVESFFFQRVNELGLDIMEIKEFRVSSHVKNELAEIEDSLKKNFDEDISFRTKKNFTIFKSVEDHPDIVTDSSSTDFLFLPTRIFRESFSKDDLVSITKKRDREVDILVGKKLNNDLWLKRDLFYLNKCKNVLNKFMTDYFFQESNGKIENKPVQVYLTSKDGAFRICRNRPMESNRKKLYASQFPSFTSITSRPYYWSTMRNSNFCCDPSKLSLVEGGLVGDIFNITGPYMDLGGNGLVITLSKAVKVREAELMLCFDFPVNRDNIYKILQDVSEDNFFSYGHVDINYIDLPNKIVEDKREFKSGFVSNFFWESLIVIFGGKDVRDSLDIEDLIKKRVSTESTREKILSGLYSFSVDNSTIVTIPMCAPNLDSKSNSYRLFFAYTNLYLYYFMFKTAIKVFIFFSVLLFIQFALFYYNKHRKSALFFQSISRLEYFLFFTHVPIVKLNSEGKIIYINHEFLEKSYPKLKKSSLVKKAQELLEKSLKDFLVDQEADFERFQEFISSNLSGVNTLISLKINFENTERDIVLFYPFSNFGSGAEEKVILGFVAEQETGAENDHKSIEEVYNELESKFKGRIGKR